MQDTLKVQYVNLCVEKKMQIFIWHVFGKWNKPTQILEEYEKEDRQQPKLMTESWMLELWLWGAASDITQSLH